MYRDNDKASNNTNNRHICVKKNSFRNQLFYHRMVKDREMDISRNI